MMIRRPLCLAGAVFAFAVPVSAQNPKSIAAPEFGPQFDRLTIPASAFVPGSGENPWLMGTTSLTPASADPIQAYAPLTLPAGTRLFGMCLSASDKNVGGRAILHLTRYRPPLSGDNSASQIEIASAATTFSDDSGASIQCALFDHTIDYLDDASPPGAYFYTLRIGLSTDTRLYGAWILWQRQVSPAPETPTWTDVPTNHPYYRPIEALTAAGISSGCDFSGLEVNFCPDAPVTRAQLALYLARALGLHWAE